VFIIAGDKDPRIPLEESVQLSEISEFVQLNVIEGCGHMSFLEYPETAKKLLLAAVG